MSPVNAIILAAGLGERLRPITDHIPKPLLPVMGRPIIETIIEKLILSGINKIGVNLHYKRDFLESWICRSRYREKIIIFPEEPILGTGGAIRNAAAFLGKGAFIAHNADILTDLDIGRLLDHHASSGNLVTLAVHRHELYRNVWIDQDGRLLHIGKESSPLTANASCVAFTGIAAYSPGFLDYLPPGKSHVTDAWLAASSSGKVGSLDFSGCRWTDIGRAEAYAAAVFETLRQEGETIYVHPSADCGDAHMGEGTVLEEGVAVSGSPSLRNCIVLPGTRLSGSARMEEMIIGQGFSVQLQRQRRPCRTIPSRILSRYVTAGEDYSLTPIGTGGSDRRYYRVNAPGRSAVLMENPADDPDFQRQVVLSRFFRSKGLPVAALMASDEAEMQAGPPDGGNLYALFEDLGDISLYSWLKCSGGEEERESMYRGVIDILVLLHTGVTDHVGECPLLHSRVFDYEHLRWETSYFMERFVRDLRGMLPPQRQELEGEFDRLAMSVDGYPKTIVHRDCQSQNIMITEAMPRLIDFQGARMGPPAYDLASLLWDPYAGLAPEPRLRLLDRYCKRMASCSPSFSEEAFMKTLLPCRLQRHMQALGAYAYLSLVKGKRYFLRFIPSCLSYLSEETLLCRDEYPHLNELLITLLREKP